MGETVVLVVAISLMVVGCVLVCMINAGTIRNATIASLVSLVAFVLFCVVGDQTVATLPQSEAFVQAGVAGNSVVEFDRRGKAAKATLALVDTVREAAGFPKE